MSKSIFTSSLALLGAFAFLPTANATHYTVDQSHSHVGFKVRHLVSKTAGEFRDFEGEFTFDPAHASASTVKLTAKSGSINTNNEKRDQHLKSGDFFDVEKFPTLTFESKKVTSTGKDKYNVEGNLTIHGVTKPATFAVEYTGAAKDPWGNNRVGFNATTKVNRKDFGIVWNKTLDTGGLMIGEDVEVALEVEGIEKK